MIRSYGRGWVREEGGGLGWGREEGGSGVGGVRVVVGVGKEEGWG